MKVHLRKRKQSKNGKISLYLEIYKGSVKTEDGKVKAMRDYEYLDIYLIDKPKKQTDKDSNKEKLKLAETIRDKRSLELASGLYKVPLKSKQKADFVKYMTTLTNQRKDSTGNYGNWNSSLKHLREYKGEVIQFNSIDRKFCQGFSDYLKSKAQTKSKQQLSTSSINSYFNKFRAAIKQAVKDGIISENPCDEVKLPKVEESPREYLTIDELRTLAKTECRYDVLKRAFLFSCLTGLRWSDVQKLTWSEIKDENNESKIVYTQQKTTNLEYLFISDQAREYLGERQGDDDKVFIGLKYSSYTNVALSQWMVAAKVNKHITFHCARHTHSLLQLDNGTDIYTLQKLLGHKDIRTTQIYSKIMDEKKKEAVNRIPKIDL